jgi:hypothetical protein
MQDVQNIPNPDIESVRENEDLNNHPPSKRDARNIEEPLKGVEDRPIPQPGPYPGQFPDEDEEELPAAA